MLLGILLMKGACVSESVSTCIHELVKLPDTGSVAVHVLCIVCALHDPVEVTKSLKLTIGLPHILLPAVALAEPDILG
jgi:hypothetical protein